MDSAVLGILAVAIGIASYVPYFMDIFSGKTKPHAFSWLIWAILTGIGFAAQITEGAGAGAWVTGLSSFACFSIFVLALSKGSRTFSKFDWISLTGAFAAIILWVITKDPLLSVILVTITDLVGFLPTFRKGYHKPHEETLITFALNSLKFIPALMALEVVNITTALYPVSLAVSNLVFVLMLVFRRRSEK